MTVAHVLQGTQPLAGVFCAPGSEVVHVLAGAQPKRELTLSWRW